MPSDGPMSYPAWNDPLLAVSHEPRRRALYRLLQSWYREHVLDVAPGVDGSGRPIGSLLAAEAVRGNTDLNFIDPAVGTYAADRIPEVVRAAGALDEHRLRHNMLSSQPLCFNIFGVLRPQPALRDVLAELFRLDIDTVESVECEWAPDKKDHLGDRTAFDAFAVYRSKAGQRGFVAIETKYTEPFSPKAYDPPIYTEVTERCGLFREGAAGALRGGMTNQLWRMSLLAASVIEKGGFDLGCIAVLALADDSRAAAAISGLREQLIDPDPFLHSVSYEQLVEAAGRHPELSSWANGFNRRYLDLSVLEPQRAEPRADPVTGGSGRRAHRGAIPRADQSRPPPSVGPPGSQRSGGTGIGRSD